MIQHRQLEERSGKTAPCSNARVFLGYRPSSLSANAIRAYSGCHLQHHLEALCCFLAYSSIKWVSWLGGLCLMGSAVSQHLPAPHPDGFRFRVGFGPVSNTSFGTPRLQYRYPFPTCSTKVLGTRLLYL